MNTTPPADANLPEIGADRIDAMEKTVFARIAEERTHRRRRRARGWGIGGAAAAVLLVAAVIAPTVTSHITLGGSAGSSASDPLAPQSETGTGFTSTEEAPLPGGIAVDPNGGVQAEEWTASGATGSEAVEAEPGPSTATDGGREIAANASAALTVSDVAEAAREIGADAEARGGYVESVNVDADGATRETSGTGSDALSGAYPYPHGGSSITVRVPSDELTDALGALAQVGEVTSSTVGRQDVTDQAIDLRARVSASEASVARLTELIGQADSVADLIAAESALSERQATLDADRQQLAALESQVALSTLSVRLSPVAPTVEADPAGFGDGLAAGWNGFVATLNGVVIALGFLLPWIVVAGIVAAVVWGLRTLRRRSRLRRRAAEEGQPAG